MPHSWPHYVLPRIAARVRFLLKPRGYGWAAAAEARALAFMTWGVATTDEKGGVEE